MVTGCSSGDGDWTSVPGVAGVSWADAPNASSGASPRVAITNPSRIRLIGIVTTCCPPPACETGPTFRDADRERHWLMLTAKSARQPGERVHPALGPPQPNPLRSCSGSVRPLRVPEAAPSLHGAPERDSARSKPGQEIVLGSAARVGFGFPSSAGEGLRFSRTRRRLRAPGGTFVVRQALPGRRQSDVTPNRLTERATEADNRG